MGRNTGSRTNPITGRRRKKVGSIALAKAKRDAKRETSGRQKRYDKSYRSRKLAKVKRQQALWYQKYGKHGRKAGTTRPGGRKKIQKKKAVTKKAEVKQESLLEKARRTGLIKKAKPKKAKPQKQVKKVQKQVQKDAKRDKTGLTRAQKRQFKEKGEVYVPGDTPKGPRGGRREGAGRKGTGLTATQRKAATRAAQTAREAKDFHTGIASRLKTEISNTKSASKKKYLQSLLDSHQKQGVILKKTARNKYERDLERKLGQGLDQHAKVEKLRTQLEQHEASLTKLKATSRSKERIKAQENYVKGLRKDLKKAERDLKVIEGGKRQKLTTEKEAVTTRKQDDFLDQGKALTAAGKEDKRFGTKKNEPVEVTKARDELSSKLIEANVKRRSIKADMDPKEKMKLLREADELELSAQKQRDIIDDFELKQFGTSTERVQKHRLKKQELEDRFNQEFYGTTDKNEIRYNRDVVQVVVSTKTTVSREARAKGRGGIEIEVPDKVINVPVKVENGKVVAVNPKQQHLLKNQSAEALAARNYQANVANKSKEIRIEGFEGPKTGFSTVLTKHKGGEVEALDGFGIILPPEAQLSRRFGQLAKSETALDYATRRLANKQRNAAKTGNPIAAKNKSFADAYYKQSAEANQQAYIQRVNRNLPITSYLPKNFQSLKGPARTKALQDAKIKAWTDKTLQFEVTQRKHWKTPVIYSKIIDGKLYMFSVVKNQRGQLTLRQESSNRVTGSGIYYESAGFMAGRDLEVKQAGLFKSKFKDHFQDSMVDEIITRSTNFNTIKASRTPKPAPKTQTKAPKSKGKKRNVSVAYARKNYKPEDFTIRTINGKRLAVLKVGALKRKP